MGYIKKELDKVKAFESNLFIPLQSSFDVGELSKYLKNVYLNLKQFERPDLITHIENKIVGIEHFEYDSSSNNRRKGSEYRIKEQNLNNLVESKIKNGEMNLPFASQILLDSRLSNIKKNFMSVLNNHVNKIDDYIKNIEETYNCSSNDIDIWFFAEDISPLGNMIIIGDGIAPYIPFFIESIDVLRNNKKIKGIIFGLDYFGRALAVINNDEVLNLVTKSKFFDIKEDQFASSRKINTVDFLPFT